MDRLRQSIAALSNRTGEILTTNQQTLVVAESCTGGWLAKCVTDLAGSSAWFDRGFVTYSNQSKQDMLEVPMTMIERYGAISETVVAAMARGALHHSSSQAVIAISGIAGPSGGTPDKPVGTVCFAWQWQDTPVEATTKLFIGDRAVIREKAVEAALRGFVTLCETK